MTDILASLEQRLTAIESALFVSLTDVIAEQLAWSKGRDTANASDIKTAAEMLHRWNAKRPVPLLLYFEPVPTGTIEIEDSNDDA